MKNPAIALLFALFLCHEACADCFVVDLLEYSAPGEMQGHAYDTFCYRDTLAYSTSIEIEERYFGKARRKGALLAVWYDSADYEGVIPAPDTSTYVRHNDTLSWVVPSKDTADRTVHFVRVDVPDESIPFFSGRDDETIGRCGAWAKRRRKSSRLRSVCDSAKVCCFKSNGTDTMCVQDSLALLHSRPTYAMVDDVFGKVRYRDEYLMVLRDVSCDHAECRPDTLFFVRLGDTLVFDHEAHPSSGRSFKSMECRFYLPIEGVAPCWNWALP